MTIVLAGGGSGGHITPILAVAAELKRFDPKLNLVYIGLKGDGLSDLPAEDPNIDAVYAVRAGKFRRYHGQGLKQFLDLSTMIKNVRDGFFVLIGIWQSYRLMKRLNPQVVFTRGGFVSVPVAFGARLRHIPYMTHDSDPIPSLANRIIASGAWLHAVALPKDIYPYPQDKTVTTGIPLGTTFVAVTPERLQRYRTEIKVPREATLLFITGGGLGSQRVNYAVAEIVPHLLREMPSLYVVHLVGRANEAEMIESYAHISPAMQARIQVFGHKSDLYRYSGAADLIITRAGATALAEFAVQGKACIVIPSPFLTGGHQLKNAVYLEEQGAVAVISETDVLADANRLAKLTSKLLKDDAARNELAAGLKTLAITGAAEKLAMLLLEQVKS